MGTMGEGKRDDNKAGHPTEGQTIRGRDDGQRRVEGGHARSKVQAVFLNADGGMVASTDPVWLQNAFYTLTGLFDRVVLRTKVRKM